MNKKKIYSDYIKNINLFKKYKKEYYERSNPKVTDEEYDNLKHEILSLEENYKFLKSEESPQNIVGHKPSKNFKKALHKVPMLSLGNAFSEGDLINFEKNKKLFIN